MYETTEINADLDENVQDVPEKALFCAIIQTAIADARSGDAKTSMLAREAMDFLLSNRINPYLELLEYEPETFKYCLVKTNSEECTTPANWTDLSATSNPKGRMNVIAKENKARRIFRSNYKAYKESSGFKTLLPYNLIYKSARTFGARR